MYKWQDLVAWARTERYLGIVTSMLDVSSWRRKYSQVQITSIHIIRRIQSSLRLYHLNKQLVWYLKCEAKSFCVTFKWRFSEKYI
jgi:hypothetical protein